MDPKAQLLVVDDDEITCNLLEEVLSKEGYRVEKALNGQEAINRGEVKFFDAVLTDIKMAGIDGMEVLKIYRQKSPDTVIIMMTAFGSIDTAIGAIKEGAYDYISKPFKLDEIKLTIRRALEQKRLLQENRHYGQELLSKYKLENIVGRSSQMLQVYKTIGREPLDGSDHRRERHGQGTGRPRHPLQQPAGRQAFCGHRLRLPGGNPAGE
jgi:two-component system response regulator AtoC